MLYSCDSYSRMNEDSRHNSFFLTNHDEPHFLIYTDCCVRQLWWQWMWAFVKARLLLWYEQPYVKYLCCVCRDGIYSMTQTTLFLE